MVYYKGNFKMKNELKTFTNDTFGSINERVN